MIPLGDLMYEVDNLEEHKDDEIVVMCRSGNRSSQAQAILEMNGFSNVRNLEGGVLAWQEKFSWGASGESAIAGAAPNAIAPVINTADKYLVSIVL